MKFRFDINAIRALAVMSVVLFHFSPDSLSGGFIGVDVFFVISGYLMTRIIVEGIEQQRFSLVGFYLDRVNRIFPALIGLCLALLVFGYFYLAPQSLDTLIKQVRYAVSFASNIEFHKEAGYFDTASKEKWLLHTWSLSIEWQFYLIYPLLLLGLSRITKTIKTRYLTIHALLAISFIVCVYLGYSSHSASPYFLLQARAWEMLLGSWAFFYKPKFVFSALPGWIVLFFSVFFIQESMMWPSAWTLLPTFATVWILWADHAGRIATLRPIQAIGRYSYSIYLWHWPVVVLFYKLELHSVSYLLLGVLISLVLGALSYYLIEPLRSRQRITTWKKVWQCQLLWVAVVIIVGTKLAKDSEGFPHRSTLSPEIVALYKQLAHQTSPLRAKCLSGRTNEKPTCQLFSDTPTWATLGDSHSAELSYSLAEQLRQQNDGVSQHSYSACPPSYGQKDDFSRCAHWANRVVNEINENSHIHNVVLQYRYGQHLLGFNEDSYPELRDDVGEVRRQAILNAFDSSVESFLAHGKEVFIGMPVPEMGRSIQSLIDKNDLQGKSLNTIPSVARSYYQARNQIILKHLEKYRDQPHVHLIPISDIFCDQEQCFAVRDGQVLYFDGDHAGLNTTKLIAQRILAESQRIQRVE